MNLSRLQIANRAAFATIAIPAIWQLSLLAVAVATRFLYPFDLEWMEGGMLDHAARIQEGAGIYTPPSADFIPFLYTPLYPAILALFGELFGLSYALGRALSILSLVVSMAIVVSATRLGGKKLEVRGSLLGILACGTIAAAYPWMEGWYDLVRGDTVFIAMILGGLHLLSRAMWLEGRRAHQRVAAVAALLALSFFCKQIGVLFVIAGGINLLFWWRWKLFLTYVGVAGVVGLGGTGLLLLVTDGWFWTYVYEVHQAHDFNWDRFKLSFWKMFRQSMAGAAIIFVTVIAIGVRRIARRKVPRQATSFLFWLLPFATSVLAGALGWATQWAHNNAYMSAVFVGAATVATGLVCVTALARAWFPKAGSWLALALPLALAAELLSQGWAPAKFIPTKADAAAGQRLIAMIADIDGEVLVPFHPWYAHLAGKETSVHRMGIMDVRYGRKHRVSDFTQALKSHRFSAIVYDNRGWQFLSEIPRYYRKDAVVPRNHRPRTYTGNPVVPVSVWIPIAPPKPPPPGARVLFDFDDEAHYTSWTRAGSAWGSRPRRYNQDPKRVATGFTGLFYARSETGGEKSVGTMTSPEFTIDGVRITARIGGGKSDKLAVELHVDGAAVRTATGTGSEALATIEWNVSALRGKRATIVLVDRDTGKRGYLSADAFWMWER